MIRLSAPGWSLLVVASAFASGIAARAAKAAEVAEPGPRVVVERILGGPGAERRTVGQWLAGLEPAAALERPYAVAWEGDELLVADPAAGRVVRFDARGRERGASPAGALEGPIALAVCRWGIAVSDSRAGTVVLLDRRLRPARVLAEELARPTGIACDDRYVYVIETAAHHVLVVRPEGGVARVFGTRGDGEAEYNFPAALALDGDALLVGDTLNFRVQRLRAADGHYLRSFGRLGDAPGETPRIKGIAVDGGGRTWITDAYLDRIAIFDREGRLLGDIGGPGSEPGQFAFPAGIAAGPGGGVAIVDSLNRRIQVLRLSHPGAALKAGGSR
ncbi:MAG: hypothetical protein F9K16_08905 [Thermoanaerobaculia bacterium]|nr:MAG: hypothetical protein F9K16_08905 [Thermoanaerobaculia bacterium]